MFHSVHHTLSDHQWCLPYVCIRPGFKDVTIVDLSRSLFLIKQLEETILMCGAVEKSLKITSHVRPKCYEWIWVDETVWKLTLVILACKSQDILTEFTGFVQLLIMPDYAFSPRKCYIFLRNCCKHQLKQHIKV